MNVFIEQFDAFFVAIFNGAIFGFGFVAFYCFMTRNDYAVKWGLFIFLFVIALLITLFPQLIELFFGARSNEVVFDSYSGDELRITLVDTFSAIIIGKVIGCLTGYLGGGLLHRDNERF